MDIHELRKQIDIVDDQLIQLFIRRMEISAQIAVYKKKRNLPIYVPEREESKLTDAAKKAGADMESYIRSLYATLFDLSRSYQNACVYNETEVIR